MRMSPFRRVLLGLAVAAAMTCAACGDPPDKEIQQAQAAIDTARTAGADRFARAEFSAAEDALKRAHEAVAQRDYRQALNNALDARERAQAAAKEAADRKTVARADAEHALTDADAALHEARARLKTAEAAHAPAKTLAMARKSIADGETAMQEAHTTFDAGDYLGAIETSRTAAGHLREMTRELASAPTSGRGTTRRKP
jgi:hypothetical protein